MSDPTALLQEFTTAVSNDDLGEAGQAAERLQNEYEARQRQENRRLQQALLIRDRTPVSDKERLAAHKHIQTSLTTQITRASYLLVTGVFLSYPEQQDRQEVQNTANALKAREAELNDSVQTVESIINEANLPPTVAVLAVQKPDRPAVREAFDLNLTIGNVGNKPAKSVRLETRGDAGISVDPPPATVGVLDNGTDTTQELTLMGQQVGSYTLSFVISSNNAGSAKEQVDVNITKKGASTTTQGTPGDQGEFAPLRFENHPDWLPMAGGAGALGLGAGAYGYLRKNSDEQGEDGR
jgi:hypothetical protein